MKDTWKPAHFSLFPVISAALIAVVAIGATASAQTPADGAAPGQVTFTKDIAPILQEKCQTCHRSEGIAPMSLLTYEQAHTYARQIKQRVMARTMPPWFIDKTVGVQHFKNDISLNDEQIATIVKWVDEGAPRGDMKDMPPAAVFDDGMGWKLAKILGRQPDLVVDGPNYTIKAHDQDQWPRPMSDVNISEPRWVMAVEMRPSTLAGRKVFHHIDANLVQDETNAPSALTPISFDANSSMGSMAGMMPMEGYLMEYAIGKNYDLYRPETGKLLMPGAKIQWEYHMHAADVDVTDHPQLAVYLYPKGYTPKYRTYLTSFPASQKTLSIPPNSVHETEGFMMLKAPARLENFQAHMHLRGKEMAVEAILPDGTTKMLSSVNRFDFKWMVNYIYADDAAPVLPKGTIIHVMAWHDNTKANPNNPDPNQWVGYGERTVDEMAHAWMNVTYLSQADYEAWAAKHKAKNGE